MAGRRRTGAASLPTADLARSGRDLLCVIISDSVATTESRYAPVPSFFLSLCLRSLSEGSGKADSSSEDRQRENEGSSSLCTSLIRHCRGTIFYFRPAEGTARCGGGVDIEEERFCSANALQGTDPAVARPSDFSFAILIKTFRKEVLRGTVAARKERQPAPCMVDSWRMANRRGTEVGFCRR